MSRATAARDPHPRPLVVLVPDTTAWVLGTWAREIAEHNADGFDFAVFPAPEIERRPDRFTALLEEAEIVHCLTQSDFAAVRGRVRAARADHVALVAAIHHIVAFEDVLPCLEADRITVMCQGVRDALITGGVPEEKLFLLRKGIDSDFLMPRSRRGARKRLGLPENDFVVGFAAKAASDDRGRKGIDVLLEALARLGGEAPLHLAVAGPGWEAVIERELPPGVTAHHFPFLARASMPDFYNAIDVYASTSRVEGGPVPPFEAMSCETPIVSTGVGCVADLVSDGAEGLLVPIGDAAATARAIARLRDDPDLALGLGTAGRRRVTSSLAVAETAAAAGRLYRSVAKAQRPRRTGDGELAALNEGLAHSDLSRWRARVRASRTDRDAEGRPDEIAHVDLAALGIARGTRVLDLGCGAGQLSLPLVERGIFTVSADLDRGRLLEVRDAGTERRLAVRPLRTDGAALPFQSGSLGAVVCREMLEHVDRPGAVLDEIARVLGPEGALCVTVPSAHTERWFQWVDRRWLDMAGHLHVFSRASMQALLEAHGFRVVEIRGRNFFYSLFWFVHTFAKTTHDGTGRIQDHFRLARFLFRAWGSLGEGRVKRWVESLGNRLFPKSYVYYCERRAPLDR